MENIVKQKLGGKNPKEIEDLHIEGSKFGTIEGLTEDFKSLQELEILNCGLKSLKGLPQLPSVKTLLLGDNFLKGKEEIEIIVDRCKGLRILSLVGNRFESHDDFQPLTSLESFVSLDVFNCPLTSQNDYRDKLWLLLPKLVVLDGYDKDGIEVADEEEDDEEEENEEDGSSNGDDDDIGLDYLQKDISDSEDEEDDYNPEAGASPPSDDHDIDGEEDEDDDSAGSSHKRPKLDPPLEDEA